MPILVAFVVFVICLLACAFITIKTSKEIEKDSKINLEIKRLENDLRLQELKIKNLCDLQEKLIKITKRLAEFQEPEEKKYLIEQLNLLNVLTTGNDENPRFVKENMHVMLRGHQKG